LFLLARRAFGGPLDFFLSSPKGSLIIAGGGDTPANVHEKFVALSGGPGKARIAILPMASTKFDEEAKEVTDDFEKLGAQVSLVEMTHSEAISDTFTKTLEEFDGYWFTGGDQSRLAGKVGGTLALEVIVRRHKEGAVIGGTSAGASVMSRVMLTGQSRQPRNPEEI